VLPDSHFMLSVLSLIVIAWVWTTLWFSPAGKGWRGFAECVGWSGFAAMFLSLFVLFAAQMMNRPFRDGEFLAVVLIELAVFTISAVCIFIPAWFPASNDVDDAE
jgi:hypothetical protein